MNDRREVVTIGIPCFRGVSYRVLDDYMRLAYHLGRRCPQYDFVLGVKGKSEQFRARNAIVEGALQTGSDWLLMLDDDHILGVERAGYDLVPKLIQHLKDDPKRGIVGALYAQRGGDCFPVVMKELPSGPSFMFYHDLSWRLQQVDITGGGCMMINMRVFDKIEQPWFAPEFEWGTDIQLCRKVREAGYSVWCDTSIIIGHELAEPEVIEMIPPEEPGILQMPETRAYHMSYIEDAIRFSGKTYEQLEVIASQYRDKHRGPIGNTKEYYKELGIDGFARNVSYHSLERIIQDDMLFLGMINNEKVTRGLDYYCGTAPVGFELALRGHRMHFYDANSYSLDFIKWRKKKHNLDNVTASNLKENLPNELDFILLLDAIEHMEPAECREELRALKKLLLPHGAIITNFFQNRDVSNLEHLNMDKAEVRRILTSLGFKPITTQFWQKWR